MNYFVYIMASSKDGAIYIGVTNDLLRRVWEHRNDVKPGHTKTYRIHRLVWFTDFPTAKEAIAYEKRLKRWRRIWKDDLIEDENPDWRDLYEELLAN